MRKLIYLPLSILILIPYTALAGTKTHDTYNQFSAGTKVNTQVDGAQVELKFQWQEITSSLDTPPLRRLSAMAYSTGTNCAILYGGESESSSNNLSDTWVFDTSNNTWSEKHIGGPEPRCGHAMVSLDADRILLFGGQFDDTNYSSATWIYNVVTSSWTMLPSTVTAPSPRAYFSMARDTTNNKIVLFGGQTSVGLSSETWVYNIDAGSWSLRSTTSNPLKRTFSAMAFNENNHLIYLFGGNNDTTLYNDLWSYNPTGTTWALVKADSAVDQPSRRKQAGLFYDSTNQRIALFGGDTGSLSYQNDVWYYNSPNWRTDTPLNPPSERVVYNISFVEHLGKALLFGGRGNNTYDDTRYLTYRSSGFFTSSIIPVSFNTSLQWKRIQWEPYPDSDQANGTARFRIATSPDSITWSEFCGPNGTSSDYYGYSGNNPISTTTYNMQYLRYNIEFVCDPAEYPKTPLINAVTIFYNISPGAPGLVNPINGGSVNTSTPVFSWNAAGDPDGDTLKYEIQVATGTEFSPLVIVSSNIATTLFQSTVTLSHSQWCWRVRANDGSGNGDWSAPFSVFVDTVAPSAINALTAFMGLTNGSINLTWTSPGDDGGGGSIVNGAYEIRFGTDSSAPLDGIRGGSISTEPGKEYPSIVTGLEEATTYYLTMRIADEAGNYSGVSVSTVCALTNAKPVISLISPTGGENWSEYQYIRWSSLDPNAGDTRTFAIYASSNSGSSFDTLIASSIAHGTTEFLWNTYQTCNSTHHRVKVIATDARGLNGEAATPADFSIFNPNKAPEVTVTFPNGGEITSGTTVYTWSVFDENLTDTHTYDMYVSSDGGNSWGWHFTVSQPSCTLDTMQFPNGPHYLIKVAAADSGSPQLSDEDISNAEFAVKNNNRAPGYFSLISPQNNSMCSVFHFDTAWEEAVDPNAEDTLSYTLYYSSGINFRYVTVISSISGSSYHIEPGTLQEKTTYYWKVVARDPFGFETQCLEVFRVFVLSRFQSLSSDGRLFAEISGALPAGTFMNIEQIDRANSQAAQAADRDTEGDRHLKSLNEGMYRIFVSDIGGNELAMESPGLTLKYAYPDTDNDNYYDGTLVPAANLRCAFLDESRSRWVAASSYPQLDANGKRIVSSVNRFGIVTMLAAGAPSSKLSSLVNYPNPFCAGKESTRIRYVLTEDSPVTATIYNLLGDLVWYQDYPSGKEGGKGQPTGYTNEITWDGKNKAGTLAANGMYICEIKAGGERKIRKIGIIK